MSYNTVSELRRYLDQVPAGADQDALLQDALDASCSIVEEVLGFAFASFTTGTGASTDKDVRGARLDTLWVPVHESASVSAVAVVNNKGLSESTTAVTGWVEQSNGTLYRGAGWGSAWYRVTAVWGYGPAPNAVKEVERQLAVNLWHSKSAAHFSDVVGVEGEGAVGYEKALTAQQKLVLSRVKRRFGGVVW